MEDNKKQIENNEIGENKVSPISLHNIYQHINISVKTLDKIIIVLVFLFFIALLFALNNRGFNIEFDSTGGSYIETQKHMYGETIDEVIPDRQGYTFDGWAYDLDCKNKYDISTQINSSFKLYACWIEDKD